MEQLQLSQEKLALKAEIDRTYLAGVEIGKRNISLKSLDKIVKALGISLQYTHSVHCNKLCTQIKQKLNLAR